MLVSHSMATIREFCDIGIYLEDGKVEVYEDLEEAIAAYHGTSEKLTVNFQPSQEMSDSWKDVPETLQKAFAQVAARIGSIEEKLKNSKISIQGLEEGFYARLANLFETLGDRKRAVYYHQKALAIDPRHVPSLQKLMLLAEHAKRWQEATDWADQLAEVQPRSPHLAMFRVRKLIVDGCDKEALERLNQIIEKHPELPGPLLEKSRILESLGKLEEALAVQAKAVQLFPKLAGLKKRQSQLLATVGDIEQSMLATWLAEPTPAQNEKFQQLAEQLGELDDRLSR